MEEREYLVHHGSAGHLGRFRGDAGYCRGAHVVVQTRRGMEVGQLLCPSTPDRIALPDPYIGELIRAVNADDLELIDRQRALSRRVFEDGAALTDHLALPLTLVDVEILFDGRHALLHAVRFAPCDDGPWLADLGARHGLIARLYDLGAEPNIPKDDGHGHGSCGDGGCGEGGCGSCSSGGCNSCSAGAGIELAKYFAELREQMMSRSRVALL